MKLYGICLPYPAFEIDELKARLFQAKTEEEIRAVAFELGGIYEKLLAIGKECKTRAACLDEQMRLGKEIQCEGIVG